jgi:ethanolamine utilization protein EutA
MHDGPDGHEHLTADDLAAFARGIWAQEHVALTSVGIDIGSSTSHLMFSHILLQRQTQGLSSRFEIVRREVMYASDVLLTPFLADDMIDAAALRAFIEAQYRAAGLSQSSVDTGAVILTGEAIKQRNARAINEMFAAAGGTFVCATAGHGLEARLAAEGSGAVALSRARGLRLLHVDIGGGTTKLALIEKGEVRGVAAFGVGGRVLTRDANGAWSRATQSARTIAATLGLNLDEAGHDAVRGAIVAQLARVLVGEVLRTAADELTQALRLTAPLPRDGEIDAISFSGGVAEYIFGRERRDFGDIAAALAGAVRSRLSAASALPVLDPGQGLRATVMGASQFSVQVSGKTIFCDEPGLLPIRNLPVVSGECFGLAAALAAAGIDAGQPLALSFSYGGTPSFAALKACAAEIHALLFGQPRTALLALVVDGDVGRSLGWMLREEFGVTSPLIAVDGVRLRAFDYIDIGALIEPPGVVPIVIKSLVFSVSQDGEC